MRVFKNKPTGRPARVESIAEALTRFLGLVSPEPNTGCWLMVAGGDTRGYAKFEVNKRQMQAHRFAYEALVGPIPQGLYLDHLCRVPCCVNPKHLEPVTNGENVLRGVGTSATNARKTHCNQGHPLEGENLRIQRTGNREYRVCRACALERARRNQTKWRRIRGVPTRDQVARDGLGRFALSREGGR